MTSLTVAFRLFLSLTKTRNRKFLECVINYHLEKKYYSQPVRNTAGLCGPVVNPPLTGELTGPPPK